MFSTVTLFSVQLSKNATKVSAGTPLSKCLFYLLNSLVSFVIVIVKSNPHPWPATGAGSNTCTKTADRQPFYCLLPAQSFSFVNPA